MRFRFQCWFFRVNQRDADDWKYQGGFFQNVEARNPFNWTIVDDKDLNKTDGYFNCGICMTLFRTTAKSLSNYAPIIKTLSASVIKSVLYLLMKYEHDRI